MNSEPHQPQSPAEHVSPQQQGASPTPLPPEEKSASQRLFTLEELRVIGYLIFLALCIRSSIMAPYEVPTASMEPTIMVGDRIIANKLAYGLRMPFFGYKLLHWGDVQRGDIIVFTFPKNPKLDFVKRVVAVAGDTIQIIDDRLYLNGELIERSSPLLDRTILEHAEDRPAAKELFVEDLGDHSFYITQTTGKNTVRNRHWPLSRRAYTVPPEAVFVMGDNRDNSTDSRHWENVPLTNIKGKAQFVFWSSSSAPGIFGDLRWSRTFQSLYHQHR